MPAPKQLKCICLINILMSATIYAARICSSIERIGELPKPKQRFVLEMLETVLAQASR